MKRNKLYIQFIENGLIIFYKDKLSEYILKSVDNYQVINKSIFIEEINKIIQTNKINQNIITDNLYIIVDSTLTNFYLSNLEQLFKELSFNKIEYINILDLINITDEELIVDISTSNIKTITKTKSLSFNIDNLKYQTILIIMLKSILKNYTIKTIYVYGNHPFINKISKNIEQKLGIKVYIYTQPNLIPLKLLI